MKTFTRALLLIAPLMALATGFSSVAQAGPAIVVMTSNFLVFDAEGGVVDIEDFDGLGMKVITENANGVIVVDLTARGLENPVGRAVIYDSEDNPAGPGTTCSVDYAGDTFYTEEWQEVISASGNMSAHCVFRD